MISSAKIHTCVFETGRVTKKKEKDNIYYRMCESASRSQKEIIGGKRNRDRSFIERCGARYRYVAEARSLICDPENGEVWIRLNDQ